MCGLAVTVSFDGRPADRHVLARMAAVMTHRGPDDDGFAVYGSVGFAFRRLAVLDLSPSGHQPMESDDGRLSIVFNGEIYNYIEIRRELEQLGHRFRTTSDTEVLLASYQQWGADCVSRFNGMWAFVIHDSVTRTLFVSRDRFGVKPLYRHQVGQTVLLASEVKAIVASGLYEARVNWRAAAGFLVRGRIDEDSETFYQGIEQVPAGSTLEISLDGRVTQRQFWSLSNLAAGSGGANGEAPEVAFRALFEDAVKIRMRSDVPVGICLSGGIDSNAILSFMGDGGPGRLQAFSYDSDAFSETRYIDESIRRTGAELHKVEIRPQQLWDVLPTAVWHYDGPLHSASALIGFELMRLARSHGVKVILSGQGADEVTAGYPDYFDYYWSDLAVGGHPLTAWRELSAHGAAHGIDRWRHIRRVLALSTFRTLEQLPGYLALARVRRAARLRRDAWYASALTELTYTDDLADPSMTLHERLQFAVSRRPLPTYLRMEDRNSMAHSVEARLPFLDYRLVSYAFSLPVTWKLRGPWNKYVVREATKGIMAEGVRSRLDKMGFPQPSRDWFAAEWYGPTRELLESRALRESGVVNVAHACHQLERHRARQVDATAQLFRLVQFGMWLQSPFSRYAADAPLEGHTAPVAVEIASPLRHR